MSGRFNDSAQSLQDQLGGDLSGDNHYHRLNPAVGLSYQPRPEFGVYGSYSESARAPTPMELTCASPTDPCRLPNEFVADPPLAQVVARTFEAGVRGHLGRGRAFVDYARLGVPHRQQQRHPVRQPRARSPTRAIFRTWATPFGRGSRPGSMAASASARAAGAWSGRPTTPTSTPPFRRRSPRRAPTTRWRTDGQIPVVAGDHLPSIPAQVGKASVTWIAPFGLALGATVIGNSGQYYRGDEANLLPQIPGYVLLNLRADYIFARWISGFVKVDNVFNADYASFGVLGDATSVFPAYTDPRFQGPGEPRAFWAGVNVHY